MARAGLAFIAAILAVAWTAPAASAATCSDYSNQADAQRAKDTRDADHDGIYCEALPCPCLKPGESTGSTKPKSTTKTSRPRVGRTVLLGKRTTRHPVPTTRPTSRPALHAWERVQQGDAEGVLRSGYTKLVRHVTAATKRKVYAAYGIKSHRSGQYEIDHLVPLELGGSNSVSNLFPEAASPRPGFHDKDRLENEVHDRACAGRQQLPPLAEAHRVGLDGPVRPADRAAAGHVAQNPKNGARRSKGCTPTDSHGAEPHGRTRGP